MFQLISLLCLISKVKWFTVFVAHYVHFLCCFKSLTTLSFENPLLYDIYRMFLVSDQQFFK